WGAISALLLWHWAARTWNIEVGRKTILLLVSIPSLPLLASWAYADMALCFYAAASLFTLTQFKTSPADSWLRIMGVLCGFAMGVKYTSFVVPLACGLLLLSHRPLKQGLRNAAHFSLIALLTALPWYLRNAFLMGNPFYPFVFGGRYWDTFLAQWYSGSGTGIGWDIFQLILLPFNAVLGYRDANFFDGRMGPLFLILFPITLWILIKRPFQNPAQNWPLISITLFSALSFLAWTVGVINSSALWQTRLLFPALLPFAIPTALGWDALTKLDSPKLRVSFLVNALIAVVIALAIFDVGLFVFRRNPLAVVFGAQSREEYIHRVNPSYAELMQLMEKLPATALVYSLYEPRSYNLPRLTQPDAIVSNFAHDLFLYQTTDEVVQAWKAQGYTHILIYERGADLTLADDPSRLAELNYTRDSLILLSRTPDGVYSIYLIP
ncbi:MAG TPA: hypothetical protein DCX53_06725, partial [Anaerolineae bacterium]|nr:hypothetical protein [Anaerolineae bacterium]